MKKTITFVLCMAVAAAALSGCGSDAKETTAAGTATVEAAAETTAAETTAAAETYSEEELTDEASITIGNYTGLKRTAEPAEVTEEQIESQLQYLCTRYPVEISGRAAKEGDVVNIDYVGTKDGEAFSGGTANGYDLSLGSGQFIDGFEDGVVGMEIGEEKDLNLTFPENYSNNPDLAGQDVVFHVTLNAIKDPASTEVDDALARRALGDVTATVETLREQVSEGLAIQNEASYFNSAGTELVQQAVENSEITVDPQMVEKTLADLKENYQLYATQYGLDLETFLSMFLGTDLDGLRDSAETVVKQEMVLEEIVKAEHLVATDEQKEALARINYFESADALIAAAGEEAANRLFEMGAAYYFLIDHSVPAGAGE